MKSIIFASLFIFSLAWAQEPIERMSITCNYLHGGKRISGTVYAQAEDGALDFAEIKILSSSSSRARVLATYRLKYVESSDLSLFTKFQNAEQSVTLQIFGDDMGGMSSLVEGNKTYDLTCGFL